MRKLLLLSVVLCSTSVLFGADVAFDSNQRAWTVSSNRITAVFRLTPDGLFLAQSLADRKTGDEWTVNQPGLPIRFTAGSDRFDSQRHYLLLDQYSQSIEPSGIRQYIVLQDFAGVAQVTLKLEVYDDQPVLRYSVQYRNTGGVAVTITSADMMAWGFADGGQTYTTLSVNQWSVIPQANFEPVQNALATDGTPVEVDSGAFAPQCGWLALRDVTARGLFLGWEFDGRTKATVSHSADAGMLQVSASILNLNHPVQPSEDFEIPGGFIGLFDGEFDEAGYLTQRFTDATLAKRIPANAGAFPYVSWDSWGYSDQVDEQTLRRNADLAVRMGVELFVIDLGWARSIGDWYADPAKFPSGLGAVSDYVHSLGMKFGLHFAFANADPASPVLQANPDWTSSESDTYHGAVSLCLSNQPARDWIVAQAIRIIDDYGVDWILQDGANMVKVCTKTTHSHDPADSNYANAVDGLNAVVAAIQAARPNVLWENCENGGNMMTFNMVKYYVTSITNDASGALDSRGAVYGATYPFSPRYADRYMPDSDGVSVYAANSYLFGGPWVLMDQLPSLSDEDFALLSAQVQKYKNIRGSIAGSKIYHIQPPAADATDAIEGYNCRQDTAVAVVTRAASDASSYILVPLGLVSNHRYRVWFEGIAAVFYMSGSQLMSAGVAVSLPTRFSSEVVHIEPEVPVSAFAKRE